MQWMPTMLSSVLTIVNFLDDLYLFVKIVKKAKVGIEGMVMGVGVGMGVVLRIWVDRVVILMEIRQVPTFLIYLKLYVSFHFVD